MFQQKCLKFIAGIKIDEYIADAEWYVNIPKRKKPIRKNIKYKKVKKINL